MSLATESSHTFTGGRSGVFDVATINDLTAASADLASLAVEQDVTVGGKLTVTGMATFNGMARFNQTSSFWNELHVRGTKAMLHNSLEIKKYETASPPAVSTAETSWIYFDGSKLKVSENGAPYINLVGENTMFGKLTTTTATPAAIIVVPTTTNSAGQLEMKVTGFDSASGTMCTFCLVKGYKNVAGVVTLLLPTGLTYSFSDTTASAGFVVVGTTVEVQVTGEAGKTWTWTANVTVQATA